MGVSKVSNKPYHINKLTLSKIEVLESAAIVDEPQSEEPAADDSSLPF